MPTFDLTFHYDGRHDSSVVGRQTVVAADLEFAAQKVAWSRNVTWIHVRTANGEVVDRRFDFIPPPPV